MSRAAYLVLENGTVFEGKAFGAEKETMGELVFTTAMTGYLETLTDPSYFGQVVLQTFPLIGNYGVIPADFETDAPSLKGYIVREWCQAPSNFRCEGKDVSINMISKSGTTTEPAIAFRVFREMLEKKYGKEGARERIYCTTDKARGTLKALADKEGYETFVVPDDVGGRFSVLTAVGLLPIAVSGADSDALMQGAQTAQAELNNDDLMTNDCYKYAAIRNILYRKGKTTEIMVAYEPAYTMMTEWFKQLYGESEGKDNKGIYPSSVVFSTDLHSLGQYIQDGRRTMFETVVLFDKVKKEVTLGTDPTNVDGLNFLSGKTMGFVNQKAFEGTVLAHNDGGVPNVVINVPEMNETELGYLIYFFEKACAISGYMLGVNPFNQPGVESYKKNMFALLGKPGYEDQKAELEARLG